MKSVKLAEMTSSLERVVTNLVDIDARIDWYGTYIVLQEQVMLINEDPREFYGLAA